MQTFTISIGHIWWQRLCGRNPLVRSSDRVEALVVAVLAFVVVVALPLACAIGTAVHDTRARLYAEQATARYTVTAIAVESGTIMKPNATLYVGRARWKAAGRNHLEKIEWSTKPSPGDKATISVDGNGEVVQAPASVGQAGRDAVLVAISFWLGVVAAVVVIGHGVRTWLNRVRLDAWDREVATAGGDGGPRANSGP